jgi:hypothetical protein
MIPANFYPFVCKVWLCYLCVYLGVRRHPWATVRLDSGQKICKKLKMIANIKNNVILQLECK